MKLFRVTTVPMSLKVLLRGQMRYMRKKGFDVQMVSASGIELDDVLAYEGCPHHTIEMTRSITPIADLKSLWKLYRLFRKERPDIVHSHTPKAGLLAMIAAYYSGVPIRIHTVAGLRFVTTTGFTRKLLVWMEKITYKFATQVWPNSRSLKEYLTKEKMIDPSKLGMIAGGSSNGINLERFSPASLEPRKLEQAKAAMQYNPSHIYFLAVGRIVKDKGIAELLKAFVGVHSRHPQTRLVLVGTLEDELDPIDAASRKLLNEHPAIVMAGWHDEVEYFMKLANFFVHASHREGFPNVILQAGAMECPVICSRIAGNIDIVTDEVTGLIFAVGNADHLEDKLEEALLGPDRMQRMAVALRTRIEKDFDQKVIHHELFKRYLELLRLEGVNTGKLQNENKEQA